MVSDGSYLPGSYFPESYCSTSHQHPCATGTDQTNNVAIRALEARLQADEIAISTLTKDVSELTQQTEEPQKPLPLPAGAKPA